MNQSYQNAFNLNIETTLETAERAKGERELGIDPVSGKKVIARMGRYGPMVQIGETTNENEKPRFAKLKASQSIETISIAEAMDLFQLPKSIGEYEGEELIVNVGRFGPYVKFKDQFVSLAKTDDPMEITLERAIELIAGKTQADAPIGHYEAKPVTKGKGRFGPFIKWDDLYINIPKGYNYDSLTQKDINELIEKKMEKEATRFIQQWPAEKITIENGRWGPFLRFGKKMLKLSNKVGGGKYSSEEAAFIPLDEVKKMILEQVPGAFDKKPAADKKPKTISKALAPAAKKAVAAKRKW